jgi:hypothetical protein
VFLKLQNGIEIFFLWPNNLHLKLILGPANILFPEIFSYPAGAAVVPALVTLQYIPTDNRWCLNERCRRLPALAQDFRQGSPIPIGRARRRIPSAPSLRSTVASDHAGFSRFGYSDKAKQPLAVVGKVTVLDDAGVGVGPVGRFAFDDVVHRLYRTPFVANLDFGTVHGLAR